MPSPLKEAYFTLDELGAQAQRLLDAPGVTRRRGVPAFEPGHAALLVLDMQRYFLDEGSHAYIPAAPAIIPGIARLASSFSARGLPVFFTRHTNTPDDAGLMASWWRDLVAPGEARSAITPELDASQGTLIEKHQYDAFYGTTLQERLGAWGARQVVVSGVMAHLCCETTARSAFMRGFQPFFLVDGTATYNRLFHTATLTNLSHGFAVLCLVDEILAALEAA
jgi:isochorismate hydrolase